MKAVEKPEKLNLQPRITPESRRAIDRIGDEWRMNVQETIEALVNLWDLASDEQRVNAIRRPVREAVSA